MATPKFSRYQNAPEFSEACIWRACCCCMKGRITQTLLKARVAPPRLKLEKTPASIGIKDYKDISFKASDGIMISGWEMISPSHTKMVLVNHPLACTRWGSKEGFDGVPVDFMPMYKHLFENGFNIVTYDNRAQGESEGGLAAFGTRKGSVDAPGGVGAEEWKDVMGAMDFIEAHPVLSKNELVLLGQCMGSSAMLGAFERHPDRFSKVRGFMINMPVIGFNMAKRVTLIKLKRDFAEEVEQAQWDQYKIQIANPIAGIEKVQCPVLMQQLKEEQYTYNPVTRVNDSQQIFDACKVSDKEIVYIGNNTDHPYGKTGKRFEAYGYLNDHPEKMLEFFNRVTK